MEKVQESNLSFEEAMEQLEKIVEKLEKGDVPLEKAISYYQEGMQLSKVCNDKLTNVQEKMTQIMNEHGQSENFHVEENE